MQLEIKEFWKKLENLQVWRGCKKCHCLINYLVC